MLRHNVLPAGRWLLMPVSLPDMTVYRLIPQDCPSSGDVARVGVVKLVASVLDPFCTSDQICFGHRAFYRALPLKKQKSNKIRYFEHFVIELMFMHS